MGTRLLHHIAASLCIILSSAAQTNDTLKILFVGNSYIYRNDLPGLFFQLAASGNVITAVSSSAFGSYTLDAHMVTAATTDLIKSRRWDIVILQEQSVLPLIESLRWTRMYPAARFLDSLVRDQGATTHFYQTWGKRYGGQYYMSGYYTIPFTDYFQMQDSLTTAYAQVAQMVNASVVPVGEAWRRARNADPSVDLWDTDNSHPSLKGSYLTACTFYAALCKKNPVGLEYTAGLSSSDAAFLQDQANQTVSVVNRESDAQPESYSLLQNYPNPFNPMTNVDYRLSIGGAVRLSIFDLLGREVAVLVNEEKMRGTYTVTWNAEGMASGIYVYTLRAGGNVFTKRMMLLR